MKLHEIEVTEPLGAIICIGIPNEAVQRFGVYFQCILDPQMVSPGGDMIRFDQAAQGGEVQGWQRIAELTVIEVLGKPEGYKTPEACTVKEGAKITVRAVKSWAA